MTKKLEAKLSEMEKFILTTLLEKGWLKHSGNVKGLSHAVAAENNKEQGDRLFDVKKAVSEFKREGTRESLLLAALTISFHKREIILSEKHRASFSRSLSRLEKRGLVECTTRNGAVKEYAKETASKVNRFLETLGVHFQPRSAWVKLTYKGYLASLEIKGEQTVEKLERVP